MGASRIFSSNVTIPMIVNHPGEYFVIGTVQLYTSINGTTAYRWDMANALASLEGRFLLYQSPSIVNEVSDAVKYASYVVISLAASIIFYFLFLTVWHRNHQVLQLSQGESLIAFSMCALFATCSCILFDAKNDTHCRLQFPLVIIPIHTMYAIIAGRLWRIHAVISPLLLEHLSKGKTSVNQRLLQAITSISFRFANLINRNNHKRSNNAGGVRRQISKTQLASVILAFVFPQLVVQGMALILQPVEQVIDFNADESIGRATCSTFVVGVGESLIQYSFFLLLFLVILLLLFAHSCRQLPSLFNETQVIYDTTFLSFILLVLTGAVLVLTSSPTVNPDVQYVVKLVSGLSITLNLTVRILLPKMRMIWNNESVVVSKLVTDHHRRAREKKALRNGSAPAAIHDLGVDSLGRTGLSSDGAHDDTFTEINQGDYEGGQDEVLLTYHSESNAEGLVGGDFPFASTAERDPEVCRDDGYQASRSLNASEDSPNDTSKNNADVVLSDKYLESGAQPCGSHKSIVPKNKATSTAEAETALSSVLDLGSGDSVSESRNSAGKEPEGAANDLTMIATYGAQNDSGASEGSSQEMRDVPNELVSDRTTPYGKRSFLQRQTSGFKKALKRQSAIDKEDRRNEQPSSQPLAGKPIREFQLSQRSVNSRATKRLSDRIIVKADETPARRLVLKMLDLQDELNTVNNKIMSGQAVTPEDWAAISDRTRRFERMLANDVEFEWDIASKTEEKTMYAMASDMRGAKKAP